MKITSVNAITGEVIEREYNDEEFAQWEADKAASEARQEAEAEAEIKRASAEAKLAALGLDAEDLRALGL
jgi:hypothetical protein